MPMIDVYARLPPSGRSDSREAGLDGLLHFLVEFPRLLAGGFDRLTDDHADRARFLQEAAPRPEGAGVVGQRHHALAGWNREHRAAHPELASVSGDYPSAFRKDDDPQTVPEPCLTLVDHLVHGSMPLATVDGDRPEQLQPPADEGNPQQFTLQHPDLRREKDEKRHRFPPPGVVAHHDVVPPPNAPPAFYYS